MQLLSIPEAARELQINASRARALVSSGELAGIKVGGRWLVERDAVARRKLNPRPAGRPLEPSNAWGALFLASGMEAPWLDAQASWRIRQALSAHGLAGLRPRLARRARPRRFLAHRGELKYLREREGVVVSGISGAGSQGLDLVSGSEIDAYVREDKLRALQRDHALNPAAEGEGNVLLRAVPVAAWHLENLQIAPLAAVAIDLAEEPDSRSARVGRQAVERLDKSLKR
jgi:excisionase family DNA binding protein